MVSRAGTGGAATVGPQEIAHGDAQRRQCRRKPGEQPGQQTQTRREEERMAVQGHRRAAGKIFRRPKGPQKSQPGGCQHGPADHSSHREQEAFAEGKPENPARARAQGYPDAELAASPETSRQEHAGDVRARHRQHEQRRAQKHPDLRAHVALQFVAQRGDQIGFRRIDLPAGGLEPGANRLDLGIGRGERHARFQAPDRGPVPLAVLIAGELKRPPDIACLVIHPEPGKLKVRRHDADHGDVVVIKPDGPTDQAGIAAKRLLPQAITDEGHGRGALFLVRILQPAAQHGRDAEGAKHPGRAGGAVHANRMHSAHIDRQRRVNSQVGKRGRLISNIKIIRRRERLNLV